MRRGAPGFREQLGRVELGSERGPETRNAGLGSGSGGGGGRSLPRLDSQACRSPCACAARGMKKRGENFLPPGVQCRGLWRWSEVQEASVTSELGSPGRSMAVPPPPARPRAPSRPGDQDTLEDRFEKFFTFRMKDSSFN